MRVFDLRCSKSWAGQRWAKACAGDLEISGIKFNPDEVAPFDLRGDERGAGPTERIEYDIAGVRE
jgi:hypothetical protein